MTHPPARMAGVSLRRRRPPPPRPDPSDSREQVVRWLPLVLPLLLAAINAFLLGIRLPWAALGCSLALFAAGWFWLKTSRALFMLVVIQLGVAGLGALLAVPDVLQERLWLNQVVEVLLMVGYVCYAFNFGAAFLPR